MPSEWRLADVAEAKAYWYDDCHVILIRGQAPTPCYDIDLEQSLLDVEPPAFVAQWRERPGACVQVVTPYEYREAFRVGAKRDEVVVYSEPGALTVPVEDWSDSAPLAYGSSTEGRAGISNLYDPLTGDELPANEAVGYSTDWNFAEAFRAAIQALPQPEGPDALARYEVVASGAEIGGIAGFDRLWVRARA